jgi:hypothetical protein
MLQCHRSLLSPVLRPSLRLYTAPVLHHPPHPHPITKPAFSTYQHQQHPALQPHKLTVHKIAPLPGIKFYLLELRGWLRYTLTRPGKAPKVFKLCDADLDDNDVDKPEKLKHGLDASAVGIQLRLLKNDGVLKVEFEGRDGAVANWTFNGLALMNGGRMVAAAATQTDVEVKVEEVEVEVKNEETQTNVVVTQSTGFQTKAVTVSGTEVQTTLPDVPLHRDRSSTRQQPRSSSKILCRCWRSACAVQDRSWSEMLQHEPILLCWPGI